jgi:gamma-glutamyltranspeptidase/glutathione hydrolase
MLSRAHLRELAARLASGAAPMPLMAARSGTALAALDAQGNRVAATLSLGGAFGSGVLAPGTGLFINDALKDFDPTPAAANRAAPRHRPLSAITPLFAEGPRGLLMAGASAGRAPSADVALALAVWMRGADPAGAAARGVQTLGWDVAARALAPSGPPAAP